MAHVKVEEEDVRMVGDDDDVVEVNGDDDAGDDGDDDDANIQWPGDDIYISAKQVDFVEWKGDVLAVAVSEKDFTKDINSNFENPLLKQLDAKLSGLIAETSSEDDFTGKAGQKVSVRVSGIGFKRLVIIGIGQLKEPTAIAYRGIGEVVASIAKTAKATNVTILVVSAHEDSQESKSLAAFSIVTGLRIGLYEYNEFKSESKAAVLKEVDIMGLGSGLNLDKKIKSAERVCSGVFFAKDLVNAPENFLTPDVLPNEATKLAVDFFDVFNKIAYFGVADAPAKPPHFIYLCYKLPECDLNTKLAIVGEGLTFDSGGCSIKETGTGGMIELMKFRRGGSAAVLGAAKAIAQIRPVGVEVHFIFGISGTGMRHGDLFTAANGMTIEVNNTDAAGRLFLADALVYASNIGVDKIVDLATLTGACRNALGSDITGIFSPSDELVKEVVEASQKAGEKLWRLPLEESYWGSMKSGVADMVSTGNHQGDCITAALFLQQFVDDKVQWLHIDMAGPVWNDQKSSATGFGVSTLVEWVVSNSNSMHPTF